MKLTFRQTAAAGERFTPDAWAGNIGKSIEIAHTNGSTPATLVDAKVSDDGTSVELTLEVTERSTADSTEFNPSTWPPEE